MWEGNALKNPRNKLACIENRLESIGGLALATAVTVYGHSTVSVTEHRGLESISDGLIIIKGKKNRIAVYGSRLILSAMSSREMLIGGEVERVEWM